MLPNVVVKYLRHQSKTNEVDLCAYITTLIENKWDVNLFSSYLNHNALCELELQNASFGYNNSHYKCYIPTLFSCVH